MSKIKNRKRYLFFMFFCTFLLALSSSVVAYNNSTYLAQKISADWVGLIFTGSYFVSFFLINYYAYFVKKITNYKALLLMLFIQSFSLIILAVASSPLWLIGFFFTYIISLNLLWISLDIFIQVFSSFGDTGRIRGLNLTLMNLGWLCGPITSGYLITNFSFEWVYALAGFLVIPVLLVVGVHFKEVKTSAKNTVLHGPVDLFKKVIKFTELRNIFGIAFLLQFFYAWMTIYMPLHLLNLGFSYSQIGLSFTIMLLPFVLFQFPAGYLADKYFGEAEMLTIGILVMGFSTMGLFFVKSFWLVTALLFCTRLGASVIEILRDSYFYKVIHQTDIDLINFFRDTGPLAFIVAPVLASLVLLIWPLEYLFVVLGVLTTWGVAFTISLPDTK